MHHAPAPPSPDVVGDLQKGLWVSWNGGAILPLSSSGQLHGALFLQSGAPARHSGPVWSLLEPFLVRVLNTMPPEPANGGGDQSSSLDSGIDEKIHAFTERFLGQGRSCCIVRISTPPLQSLENRLPVESEVIRRVFPEESLVLCDGKTIYAAFASSYEIDSEIYLRVLRRALKELHPESSDWEIKLEIIAPGDRAERR